MCEANERFSTIVGRRRDVIALGELWQRLITPARWELSEAPEHIDLTRLGDGVGHHFAEDDCPAVAVVRHPPGVGLRIAAELQAEVMAGNPFRRIDPLPSLLVEPGFFFQATQPGAAPTVNLDPSKLEQVVASVPTIAARDKAPGIRVALLDTGLLRPNGEMADFTGTDARTVPADDLSGHGTAMAQVIEAVRPGAEIYPVRVLGADKRGPSHEVLAGMIFVLWSGEFDIVNASLTADDGSDCETSLGRSLDYLLALSRTNKESSPPLIVAAAGNNRNLRSGYPAILPGAVVVVALEYDAASDRYVRASYNSKLPDGAWVVKEAYGGSDRDSLGEITPAQSQTAERQWGTSIATAAVTGAFVPD